MEVFSARLKWLREQRGFTQADMADKINMSRPGYTKIEQGQREPKLEVLAKLPEILGESVDFLLGVTDLTSNLQAIYNDFVEASAMKAHFQEELETFKKSIEFGFSSSPDSEKEREHTLDYLRTSVVRYTDKLNLFKLKLTNLLNQIPMISEETLKEIEYGDPWGYLLKDIDDIEVLKG